MNAIASNGRIIVEFEDAFFRDINDFFKNAEIEGTPLRELNDKIDFLEIIK